MKVNKEEILGMYVALERYVNLDHDKEWKMWEDRVATIENAVRTVNGVTTEVTIPPIANHTPALEISWDTNLVNASQSEIRERLLAGEPSVMVRGSGDSTLNLTVFMLKPGQENIVADRIQEELSKALA
jgi:L-seryl-tRNA(Ser) seleniumtransferase